MAKNLIPDICKLLGVEVGEEFKIDKAEGIYKITEQDGLLRKSDLSERWLDYNCYFDELFTATYEIVKLPWELKENESFWSFYLLPTRKTLIAARMLWNSENVSHLVFYKEGWVYRTRGDAEAALPKVAKELGVEYEL